MKIIKGFFKFKAVKITTAVIGAILILSIGSAIGSSDAKTNIEGKTVSYSELLVKIDAERVKLDGLKDKVADAQATIKKGEKAKKELADVEAKLKDKQGALDKELADGRKDIEAKLADAQKQADAKIQENNNKVSETQSTLDNVNKQLQDTQAKLASATGQLQQAEGAPKTLGAGQYIVGKDIPSGRYTAHALGRGSNFFVYDGDSGRAKVNTILGNSTIGSGDYTFFTSDGDIIETRESARLTPMK